MKYNFQNILKLRLVLLSALLFTISSCDNDEDTFNPLLVSIDVPEGLLNSTDKFFLVASDKDGEVIEFAEVKGGEITELKSDSYKESTFTLSIVDTYSYGDGYKDFYGSSYHGLKRGVKIVLSEEDFEEQNYFNFTAENFDLNTASEYRLAGNDTNYSLVYPNIPTGSISLTKSPTRLFITKFDQNYVPSGYMFPTNTYATRANSTVNLSGNYAAFQSETVNLTDPVYSAGVSVYGRTGANNYEEQYLVFDLDSYELSPIVQSLTIKYPGTTFPVYSSESYIEVDDFSYWAYNKSQRSDFSMMDVDATVTVTDQTISYSLTGDGSITSFDFNQEGNDFEYYDWDMYGPVGSSQSLTIPKLPSEITADFTSYSYTSWETYGILSVMEIETIDSVDEYLGVEMGTTDFYSLNSKYMSLYTNSGVAREARMNLVKEKKREGILGNFKARFEKDKSGK